MNYGDLLKRAARLTWRYKVLWIFGILLALTAGGGGGGGGSSVANSGNGAGAMPPAFSGFEMPGPEFWAGVAGVFALCCCLLLILAVVATIVQYVARTALYRSVDQIEETGATLTWRQGFRLGWSNRALRMFLLDLLVGIVAVVASLILLTLAAAPLLLLLFRSDLATALGIAGTIGLEILVILVIVVAIIIINVLQQFWRREIALADRTVGEALSLGTRLARRKAGDVAVFWLLMAVIGVVFGLVLFLITFALIFAGVVIGGGLGYGLYALSDSWILALVAGLPIFLVIMIIPTAIVKGIYLVFESSAWTLAYRDVVKDAGQNAVEPLPAL